ncbi:hypothetical protein N9Y14_05045, partial [Alphaproteobacteria bacterium]|nr:hypothetical protein [Alphaproteobacteria bacterium]
VNGLTGTTELGNKLVRCVTLSTDARSASSCFKYAGNLKQYLNGRGVFKMPVAIRAVVWRLTRSSVKPAVRFLIETSIGTPQTGITITTPTQAPAISARLAKPAISAAGQSIVPVLTKIWCNL